MTTASDVATARVTVGLLGTPVTIRSDSPGLVSWLREFVLPAFDESDEQSASAEIVAHATHVSEAGAAGCELLPAYALGEKLESLRGSRSGASTVVDDEYFGVRIAVTPGRVDLRPLAPPFRLRPATFRVCRELALGRHSAEELHAAAYAVGERVLVLAGAKGAGKTTLLARIATVVDGGVVANDRVLLDRREDEIRVRGIPTFAGVREGTRALMPDVFGGVGNRKHRLDRTVEELGALPPEPPVDGPPLYGFSPAQLAGVLGSRVAAGGTLASIALVSVDLSIETFAVDRLSSDEAGRRLSECFRNARPDRAPTIFERCLGYDAAPAAAEISTEVAARVRCVGLRVGRRLLADDLATHELVARLLDQ